MVLILVVLNIYFAFIDEFYYIDRCYTGAADKSKLAGTLDKYRQALFFSIYFLSVMVVPTLAIGFQQKPEKRLVASEMKGSMEPLQRNKSKNLRRKA